MSDSCMYVDEVQEAVEDERRRCMGILMSLARGLNDKAVRACELQSMVPNTVGQPDLTHYHWLSGAAEAYDDAAGMLNRVAHGHEFFG